MPLPCRRSSTQGLQLGQILAHVPRDVFQVRLQRGAFLAVLVPIVDLQGKQDAEDDQQQFTEGIGRVLAKGIFHKKVAFEASEQKQHERALYALGMSRERPTSQTALGLWLFHRR
jgi:hypothetical protein